MRFTCVSTKKKKSILAIRLINGKTFVSASASAARLSLWNIKRAEVAFPRGRGQSRVVLWLPCSLLTRKWSDGGPEAQRLYDRDK